MVLKSLDNLEKRIVKVEGEMGRVKKTQLAAPTADKSAAHSDSLEIGLSARLDSLILRVKALEKNSAPPSATAPKLIAAGVDTGVDGVDEDEIASLVREVKTLTELLRQDRLFSARLAAHPVTPDAAPSAPAVAKPAAGLELKGDIQIQGERKFTSASNRNNLDDLWGRLNFGTEYNQHDFQSKINIRIFPEGFGFEPLTGATFDTTGQGSLKTQTQPSSRMVINNAWVKYTATENHVKVGRFETLETQSLNFGNYIDLGTGGKFESRPAVHNAVEVSRNDGALASSVLLGTNDRNLDRGFLRIYEKFSSSKDLQAAFGYRANVFDRFKYPDDEILQRFDANLVMGLPSGWKAFLEAGLLQAAGKDDETPILIGVQPYTGKALDLLSLEAEWVHDRKVASRDRELFMNFQIRKTVGRLKLESGIYSDVADPEWNAFVLGLRLTSNIK